MIMKGVNIKLLSKGYFDELFNEPGEVNSFSDVLVDIELSNNLKVDTFDRRKAFDLLPDDMIFTALQWGLSDTEFREAAYKWFKDNYDRIPINNQ